MRLMPNRTGFVSRSHSFKNNWVSIMRGPPRVAYKYWPFLTLTSWVWGSTGKPPSKLTYMELCHMSEKQKIVSCEWCVPFMQPLMWYFGVTMSKLFISWSNVLLFAGLLTTVFFSFETWQVRTVAWLCPDKSFACGVSSQCCAKFVATQWIKWIVLQLLTIITLLLLL